MSASDAKTASDRPAPSQFTSHQPGFLCLQRNGAADAQQTTELSVPLACFVPIDSGQVHRHRNDRRLLRSEEIMCNPRRTEPSLDELLEDSAMRLLMRRDGVTDSDVRALLCKLQDARAVGSCKIKSGCGGAKSAGPMPNRREMIVSSRAASEAGEKLRGFM